MPGLNFNQPAESDSSKVEPPKEGEHEQAQSPPLDEN